MSAYALLDDPTGADSSRLYTGYVASLRRDTAAQLPALLAALSDRLQRHNGIQRDDSGADAQLHALGLFSYEIGAAQHGIAQTVRAQHDTVADTGAEILLFRHCRKMTPAEVEDWLASSDKSGRDLANGAGVSNLQANVNATEFDAAIARIRDYIEAGDTYQINYTYRMRFDVWGAPLALYRRLRLRQPASFGALIEMPDGRSVLSLSPELFLRHAGGQLTARPMKGTAAASSDAAQTAATARELASDPKNRAENLMIVDLLRNDLSRIAKLGSVNVPAMFEVARHGDVLQMTSTVSASLRSDASLGDIFNAAFPCGSITGAPKRRSMQIIHELEPAPRGLYTGAIGWFDAAKSHAVPDFCLSVPIRTLLLQAPDANGMRRGEMGVGAGIVHDSVAASEYAECQLKASFLTGLRPQFSLFETMLAEQGGCRHLDRHLQRLARSAQCFGFTFDAAAMTAQINALCRDLQAGQQYRLRAALQPDGGMELQVAPLTALTTLTTPVRLLIAPDATSAQDLFLRHKTTLRATYDAGWRAAEAQGAFDMLFFNTQGALTEGGRSNVFVRLDGRWYTPPLADGVLPGVMRAVLLEDPTLNATERSISMADLRRAQALIVCNALRGALTASIDWPSP